MFRYIKLGDVRGTCMRVFLNQLPRAIILQKNIIFDDSFESQPAAGLCYLSMNPKRDNKKKTKQKKSYTLTRSRLCLSWPRLILHVKCMKLIKSYRPSSKISLILVHLLSSQNGRIKCRNEGLFMMVQVKINNSLLIRLKNNVIAFIAIFNSKK